MKQVWAAQEQGAVRAEWRPSAGAGRWSSGRLGSEGPQTAAAAAAACAAEPVSGAESGCMLE